MATLIYLRILLLLKFSLNLNCEQVNRNLIHDHLILTYVRNLQEDQLSIIEETLSDSQFSSAYVISVDQGYDDTQSGFWNTSQYTKNLKPYELSVLTNVTKMHSPVNFKGDKEYFEIKLNEQEGVVTPFMKIFNQSSELIEGQHYKLTSNINQNVFPNYFKTNSTNSSPVPIMCNYVNTGLSYNQIVSKFGLNNVVNLLNYNFGLIYDKTGIKVIRMQNFSTTLLEIENFYPNNLQNNFDISNVTFKSLFLSNPNYSPNAMLAAVSTDNKVYLFNVTDWYNAKYFTVTPYLMIDNDLLEDRIINQFSFKEDSLIFSSLQGLLILKLTNGELVKTYGDNLSIKDFIVNNSTIYVLILNEGMRIFDFKKNDYTDYLFEHPSLKKFDYVNSIPLVSSGVYYVGIAINNNPPEVSEFFIELISEGEYELNPRVNKIFTSNQKFVNNDIATDHMGKWTYVLDRENKNVYMIKRASPNNIWTHNYIIKIDNDYKLNSDVDEPLFIIAEYGANKIPNLALKNDLELLVIGNFTFPETYLNCSISEEGQYHFYFSSNLDCNSFEEGKMRHMICPVITRIDYNILSQSFFEKVLNLISLWVVLAIILLIIIILIIWKCFFNSKPKELNHNYIRGQGKETSREMIEKNFDNKL